MQLEKHKLSTENIKRTSDHQWSESEEVNTSLLVKQHVKQSSPHNDSIFTSLRRHPPEIRQIQSVKHMIREQNAMKRGLIIADQ